MKKWKRKALFVLLAGMGCSPAASPIDEAAPATPVVMAPLPGANYTITYAREGALWVRDTRDGSDRRVSASVSDAVPVTQSGSLAALRSRSTPRTLYLANASGSEPRPIHEGSGDYSFAWSSSGERLAYGYRDEGTAGSKGIWVVGPDQDPRNVGCRAADRVHAWRGDDGLLVGDAANVYTVNARDCATLATLPRQGKRDFAFARNGSRLSFYRSTPQGLTLFLANNDGSGARPIADPQVAPRDVQWSPDASKLAFVINSPRFANRSHVAVHDVATNQVSFNDRETPLGVPNESQPCWSPDSRRVLFDRVFDRSDGTQVYQMRQKIVKAGSTESMVFEELRREGMNVLANPCRWLDNRNILVASNDGYRVVNVDGSDAYQIGEVDAVLMVQIHAQRE